MTDMNYEYDNAGQHPIKSWTRGVAVEDQARQQLRNIASLPANAPKLNTGSTIITGGQWYEQPK